MRIMVVMPSATSGAGAEQSFRTLAPDLLRDGTELHFVVLTKNQAFVPELEGIGVIVHDLSRIEGTLQRARSIRRVVEAIHPDLVHAVLFEASVPTQMALLAHRVPLLVTWASTHQLDPSASDEGGGARWKLWLCAVLDGVLGRLTSTRYHAVTAGSADSYRAVLRVGTDRVRIVERGREPESFVVASNVRIAELRQDLELPDEISVVLAVARQEPPKGLDTLLEVIDELGDSKSGFVAVVAGREGRSTSALKQQHDQMRHPELVKFLGHRDDVSDLLSLAQVVVCTSRREGAAGALLEAMAIGRPIVSVALRGLDGVLTDGVDSIVTDRSNLAASIRRVLDDPKLRSEMGRAATATFQERFTSARSARAMAEMYVWAALPRPPFRLRNRAK